MKLIAKIIALYAPLLVGKEWPNLRIRLVQIFDEYKKNESARPSILAQQLLISGEDHRFFSHGGIDFIAIFRAIWRTMVLGRREGASTIEMQIVRVVSGRYEKNIKRKIREMALAVLVCREIPKEFLPAIYLHLGYFGWRMNGFTAACKRINSNSGSLSEMQVAQLVSRLKYPEPRIASRLRQTQINRRAKHLLKLRRKHCQRRTYFGLNALPTYAST